jgi:hypothetical protein
MYSAFQRTPRCAQIQSSSRPLKPEIPPIYFEEPIDIAEVKTPTVALAHIT